MTKIIDGVFLTAMAFLGACDAIESRVYGKRERTRSNVRPRLSAVRTTDSSSEPCPVDNTSLQPVRLGTMFRLIREDLRSHHNDWTAPGFQASATHRLGSWGTQIKSRFLRVPSSV